jgi:CRISPR-associated protein Cas1
MRKLLNTLYVTQPDTYLALDGENVVVRKDDAELMRLPLHNLEGIVAFGYTGASPALMGACASHDIDLSFYTQSGRFLARVSGEIKGNVLLRHRQHQLYDSETESLAIAKNMIAGKIYNSRWVLERTLRDHEMRVDASLLKTVSLALKQSVISAYECTNLEQLRGVEGNAAESYFSVFNQLILQNKDFFIFNVRNRRPPLDPINALLSFSYMLLAKEAASALESVGLDPYMGFLHRGRPGRASLALDLMEELRPAIADRFVLTLINRREVDKDGFITKENGAVIIKDDVRKTVLRAWQARKQEIITHPFLDEKISWGLVPYAQALLLARYLRGDLDEYPPFMWK